MGFANGMQAVVYDRNGANYCGRLWWMLKWVGHDAVAVLDGGLQAWQAAGGGVAQRRGARAFPDQLRLGEPLRRLVGAEQVLAQLQAPGQTVIDARAAPRYRGEVEPLDPVAGHIPGALNRPFTDNLGADGQLQERGRAARGVRGPAGRPRPRRAWCTTAAAASAPCPNLLAMELAGLGKTALYAGSWSEWCSDPARPVERG